MISDRQLALEGIGKLVAKFFEEGDKETAWLMERWGNQIAQMTDQEFIEQYKSDDSDIA